MDGADDIFHRLHFRLLFRFRIAALPRLIRIFPALCRDLRLLYLIGHAIHLIGHRIEFALQIRLCGSALAHGRGVGRQGVAGVVVRGYEGVVDQRLHGKLIVIAAVRDDLIYPGQGGVIAGLDTV